MCRTPSHSRPWLRCSSGWLHSPPGPIRRAAVRAGFAQELARAGDRQGAREVIRAALAATRSPTPQQRIAYAGALVGAGYPRDAKVVTAGLSADRLNPLQRGNLQVVQDNAAVSAADTPNGRGQTADALSELTPRLQQDPANPALNMALARVYQAQKAARHGCRDHAGAAEAQPGRRVGSGRCGVRGACRGQNGPCCGSGPPTHQRLPRGAAGLVRGGTGRPRPWRQRCGAVGAAEGARPAEQAAARPTQSDASDVLVPGWLPGRQYALNQAVGRA